MDETTTGSAGPPPLAAGATSEGQIPLIEVVASLEEALKILESMQLTLPVALLDHAIAETKRHLTP
jgi:hypothetical protein